MKDDLSGTELDRYQLVSVLGQGSMGVVYLGIQQPLNRKVAVKVLNADLAESEALMKRFRREAELAASLSHPNIVQVTDFGIADGRAYLVMEVLEGQTFEDLIQDHAPLEADQVTFIARQVLDALIVAHDSKIVHRDLKPDNVFLTSVSGIDNIVKLFDFGIARFAGRGRTRMTQAGQVLGTPAYMSPEQARGLVVDYRSDLYSLAAAMYEALTGQLPAKGDNYQQVLFAIVGEDPDPIESLRPDLAPDLVVFLKRAMEKDPDDRFQDAKEMKDALLSLSEPPKTARPGRPSTSPARISNSPVAIRSRSGDEQKISSTLIGAAASVPPAALMSRSTTNAPVTDAKTPSAEAAKAIEQPSTKPPEAAREEEVKSARVPTERSPEVAQKSPSPVAPSPSVPSGASEKPSRGLWLTLCLVALAVGIGWFAVGQFKPVESSPDEVAEDTPIAGKPPTDPTNSAPRKFEEGAAKAANTATAEAELNAAEDKEDSNNSEANTANELKPTDSTTKQDAVERVSDANAQAKPTGEEKKDHPRRKSFVLASQSGTTGTVACRNDRMQKAVRATAGSVRSHFFNPNRLVDASDYTRQKPAISQAVDACYQGNWFVVGHTWNIYLTASGRTKSVARAGGCPLEKSVDRCVKNVLMGTSWNLVDEPPLGLTDRTRKLSIAFRHRN